MGYSALVLISRGFAFGGKRLVFHGKKGLGAGISTDVNSFGYLLDDSKCFSRGGKK